MWLVLTSQPNRSNLLLLRFNKNNKNKEKYLSTPKNKIVDKTYKNCRYKTNEICRDTKKKLFTSISQEQPQIRRDLLA